MPRRLLVVLLVGCVMALSVTAKKHDKDPVFGKINSIVSSLANISGLSAEHAVPYGTLSKRQLRHFLSKRIKKTLSADEIHSDELALKMFGLVPSDFDLKKSTVDLLTEQAAAFYDYDEKKLFILAGSPLNEETTTLAHELAHAVADQHFNLGHFMDDTPENDDENLAHTAVVEGQASWLMIAYNLVEAGKPAEPTPEMLKSAEDSGDTSASDYPVLKASPLYIQQSLLFPYSEGTRFFDAVYRRMGRTSFGAVFLDAPVSSAQVLHPERYFAHEKPLVPELPKLDLSNSETGGKDKQVTEGTVGEFDLRMMLWQYVGRPEADQLAPHLLGAQFRVTAGTKNVRPVLEYVARWDSEQSAARYFTDYKKILRGKWKRCDLSSDTAAVFAGTGDAGFFVTHLKGDTLTSYEGLEDAATWALLRANPQANPRVS